MSLERGSDLEIRPSDAAPSLAIGTVTTLAAGASATVVNSGTAQNAIIDIGIPQGVPGIQGNQGTTGTAGTNGTNGTNGVSPNIIIGTVTTLSPGASATATLTGSFPNQSLNLGIPQGAAGSGTTFAWGAATGTLSDQADLQTALTAKAPLASPAFTGSPTAPTASPGDNDTSLATTAFVTAAITAGAFATLASPALTGTPTAPTPTVGDNDTSIATTAFVAAALAASLVSPAFSGSPTVPTATAGDNDTSIASTAFVHNELTAYAKLDGAALIDNPTVDGAFIGYRNLPTSRSVSASITLADSDKGKKIIFTGSVGRTLTLNPNGTTAIDVDAIGTIVNDSTANVTVARGAGVAAKLMGTGADANRTIAPGGIATWLKTGTNSFYVGGPGVS